MVVEIDCHRPGGAGNPDWSNIMTLQYNAPSISAQWAAERDTDMAAATAIHAIAGGNRTPEAIWESPTPAEFDHVTMAVENYVAEGVFPADPRGRYSWGQAVIVIAAHADA